jgi:hypothetical protein
MLRDRGTQEEREVAEPLDITLVDGIGGTE